MQAGGHRFESDILHNRDLRDQSEGTRDKTKTAKRGCRRDRKIEEIVSDATMSQEANGAHRLTYHVVGCTRHVQKSRSGNDFELKTDKEFIDILEKE